MRDLLRLLAKSAIAERDSKQLADIKTIVGTSLPKAKAVQAMNGQRSQTDIHEEIEIQKSPLSKLIKSLSEAGLLAGDSKWPKLAIQLPPSFFEEENS